MLTVHGDQDSCTMFAEQIRQEFGLEAEAAQAGQTVQA